MRLTNILILKIGCRERPACFCGFHTETVKHFFHECPLYSAPRITLLSSAARIFADRWSSMSKSQIIPFFCLARSYYRWSKIMIYFFHVQSFISESIHEIS